MKKRQGGIGSIEAKNWFRNDLIGQEARKNRKNGNECFHGKGKTLHSIRIAHLQTLIFLTLRQQSRPPVVHKGDIFRG